ncbi:MAG: inositol-1-monophosphatase [Dehalococcoidia bacterium]|nr:inositol-1-monophosphatase [Dehalococcoidia bacterium]
MTEEPEPREQPTESNTAFWEELEATARELAQAAGTEIANALGRSITVDYKTKGKSLEAAPTDPVSEIDRAVEEMIRARLSELYPDHAILGEEKEDQPPVSAEYLWAIDPVDGTTNFVNRYPLFAASVGVLHEGMPVAGAVWCSASHTLGSGVYHAHWGGPLRFEGDVVKAVENQGVRRSLSAVPGGGPGRSASWDNRVTGSAAIECAYVAAGVFTTAQFWGVRAWDLAAGLVLIEAAGREALIREGKTWEPFQRFSPPSRISEERAATLRDWSRPVLVGEPEGLAQLRERIRRPGIIKRATNRLRGH